LGGRAADCDRPCVWVYLEQGERDVQQFLAFLVAAVQTVGASIGASAWALLQTTPPPSAKSALTALLDQVAEDLEAILQVLDDYDLVASVPTRGPWLSVAIRAFHAASARIASMTLEAWRGRSSK